MEPSFLSEIFGNKATCSSVTFTKTSVSEQFGHWHTILAYHHMSLFQRWLLEGSSKRSGTQEGHVWQ